MQVVFVHGVNTRDPGDGSYDRWIEGRRDRLTRLAFGKNAKVHFPYWGKYGLAEKTLVSIPRVKGAVEALGMARGAANAVADSASVVAAAKRNFPAVVASLSVEAIAEATLTKTESERREVEDLWMAAASYAEARPVPSWLPAIRSQGELGDRIAKEVAAMRGVQALGAGWFPSLPSFDLSTVVADKVRDITAPYLAQFLGDAMMFFARREQSSQVRTEISNAIVQAAGAAIEAKERLVLIGHSMGGSILHEILTDPDAVAGIERDLKQPLKVDLFLGVGTQVGLFAELRQFSIPAGQRLLSVEVEHYWNIYDYSDTLAFLSEPVIDGTKDLEVSTAAGVANAHTAYFDNALFFTRLNKRLNEAGLLGDTAV